MEVQNSLLFLEVPEVVYPILGECLCELDGAGAVNFQPVAPGRPEHLGGEVLEASASEFRGVPGYLDEGHTRLVMR